MKKLTLFAIALLASVASFAALNPFAYALSSTLSADETKLTVNYSLNAPATAVNIVVLNGETVVKHISSDKIAKGSHTVEISTADFPKTTNLTWRIEVSGSSVKAPTLHDTSYRLYHPSGVDIDNNPENPTFGLILTNEAMQSVASKTDTYLSAGFGAGIFAFNAAFEPIKNGDKPGYNGGITFTNGRYDNSSSTAYAPRRIRISENGRIFVTSLNTNGTYLWEVNPENLNEWTPVFKGTRNANFELVDANGAFIAAPNVGFDVKGSGENLKLLMLSSNKNGFGIAYSGYQTHEYNLGTATEWTTAPTKKILGGKYIISYTSAQVEYDNEGGVWICQNRTTSTDAQPSLIHINADGNEDYKEILHARSNAGIRFNKDFTKIIIAGNKTLSYNKDGNVISSKKATIYTISKDGNGKPVLTEDLVIDMSTLGSNLNDFAFDYAGNLYGVSNTNEKIAVWAMPYSGMVATPAPSKYAFQLQEEVQGTFYTLVVNVDETKGTVTGNDGQYEAGATATLTATANEGHKFLNWTVGEETLTDNPLTLTVNSDLTVTANFEALPAYTITATANDAAMGSVAGAGTYYEGETITLTATANTGHKFINWSNNETANPLTFTAAENVNLTANFEVINYTVTALTNDENKGTIEGAGTYAYGTEVTLTATPADGYELLYWSDRSTDNPRTITVDGNEALSAYFVKEYEKEPTFTIEKVWENTNVPASTSNGYQAAGWDGKIYMKDRLNKNILVFSDANTSATYAAADNADDQSITADDAGNLILRSGSAAFYNTPIQVIIYKKDETKYTTINFTLPAGGRCDFISASGDVFSEEGGYVYFYCQNQTMVNRVKIANGEYVSVEKIGNNLTAGQTQAQVTKNIFGNIITHARTANPQEVDVTTGMVNNIILPNFKISTCGMATFELGGKELMAYNVAGTDFNSEWNLYNMTDQKFLSETALYAKNTTEKNSAANWLNVQVVDEKTAYIYQFCPKVAAAVWKVTCDTGEEPEGPTSIENIETAAQAQKVLRDGQVLIIRDGKTYNMMGQEVK